MLFYTIEERPYYFSSFVEKKREIFASERAMRDYITWFNKTLRNERYHITECGTCEFNQYGRLVKVQKLDLRRTKTLQIETDTE